MIRFDFMGHELHLFLSASAMFEIEELEDAWNAGHVEDGATISDILSASGAEGGEALALTAGILSEAGAAAREYLGKARGDVMTGDAFVRLLPMLTPKDLLALRGAVTEALAEGYRESGEQAAEEEIDLGLQEIERRERAEGKKDGPGRRFFSWPRRPGSQRGTR